MSSCIEYKIFRNVYSCLHTGIQPELDQLLPIAYENALIGNSTKEEAQLTTRSPPQRASTLLSAIDNRIQTNPTAFYIFMKVLRLVPSLGYLADNLQEKLVEQPRGQALIVSESDGSSIGPAEAVYVPTPSVVLPQGTLVLGSVQPGGRNICIVNQTSFAKLSLGDVFSQSGDNLVQKEIDSVERNVAQGPADASCQTPPNSAVPFQKQQSQRQSSLSPPVDNPLQQLLRTQPSIPHTSDKQEDQTGEVKHHKKHDSRWESVVSLSDSETLPSPKSPLSHSSDSVFDSFKSACSHFTVSKESILSEHSEGDSADETLKRELDQTIEKCKETIDKKTKQIRRLMKKLKHREDENLKLKDKVTSLRQECKETKETLRKQQSECHPRQETTPSAIEIDGLRRELQLTLSYLDEVDAERKILESELGREREQSHFQKEKIWELRCKAVKLNIEVHKRDKTIVKLTQHIQEFTTEFIDSCGRKRSNTI